MTHHLTLPQITLLVAVALTIAVFLVVMSYLLHRIVREHRRGLDLKPSTPRAEHEPAFVAATIQGVIAELKSRQDMLEERLRKAERHAHAANRALQAVAQRIPQGLLVINAEGFVVLANDRARQLLQADFWSRRRFVELFANTPLAEVITECITAGKTQTRESIAHVTPSGQRVTLFLRAEAIESPGGTNEGVVCLLWEDPESGCAEN